LVRYRYQGSPCLLLTLQKFSIKKEGFQGGEHDKSRVVRL
jgi:hypothetical protein